MSNQLSVKLSEMYERPTGSQINLSMNLLPSKQAAKPEIHVLLVDHDTESLTSIAKMLGLCSYKVKMTRLASNALEMLSNGHVFDMIIANINSPEMQAHKLLEEAVRREILIMLIVEREDADVAERALQNGALFVLKKPPPMDMLKLLWQHVERERIRRNKERRKLEQNANEYGNLDKVKVETSDVSDSLGVEIEKNDNKKSKETENTNARYQKNSSKGKIKVNSKDLSKRTSKHH